MRAASSSGPSESGAASSLEVSPTPFLIAQILAANIGGAATLVGDPPNILIASAADIDFVTFAANMAPLSIIILLCFLGLCRLMFAKEVSVSKKRPFDLDTLRTSELITDPGLLFKSLVVMAMVVIGFLLHSVFHLQPATIAMFGELPADEESLAPCAEIVPGPLVKEAMSVISTSLSSK